MTMIRFFPLCLMMLSVLSYGQDTSDDFWSRVRFGGNLGASFSDNGYSILVAPQAVYQVSPRFSAGPGLVYSFAKRDDVYRSSVYGISALGIYRPIDRVQASLELEQLRVDQDYDEDFPARDRTYWVPAMYLGAGYTTGNVTVGLRYNVLFDDDRSITQSAFMPFVRVFF